MTSTDIARAPSVADTARAAGDKTPWVESLRVAVVARAAFFAVAIAASWFLAGGDRAAPAAFADLWRWWDAAHFLTIAEHGYTAPQSDQHAAAFFPAFPLAVRVLLVAGMAPVAAGLLISAAGAVVAGAFLYRLAEEDVGAGAGRRALLYLTIFPTAVFLVAPYSESLFLAGAIPAFYLARRQRWHLVGLPAALAMGARAAGVFLVVGLVFEFVRQRDFAWSRLANAGLSLAIALVPLLAYGAFLGQAMGDPLVFIEHQREGWGRMFVGPVASFTNTWNTWDPGAYPTNWLLAWRIEIVAAAVGLGFTVWAFLKREWGYGTFMGSMLLALIASTWYYSIPRMLLTMFPIFLFLSEVGASRRWFHEWLIVGLAPLATLGVIVFTSGAWFF